MSKHRFSIYMDDDDLFNLSRLGAYLDPDCKYSRSRLLAITIKYVLSMLQVSAGGDQTCSDLHQLAKSIHVYDRSQGRE